jgi:hypothetical protein
LNGGGDYQWLVEAGTSSIGEILPESNATGYVHIDFFGVTPRTDSDFQHSFGGTIYRGSPELVLETGHALPTGSEQHVALVIQGDPDGAAGGANGLVSLDRNAATEHNPALINQVNTWIGRSNHHNPFYAGSVDELRIYDEALSAEQIGASFRAGPNQIVPEPGAALGALGLGGLALMRRRTK